MLHPYHSFPSLRDINWTWHNKLEIQIRLDPPIIAQRLIHKYSLRLIYLKLDGDTFNCNVLHVSLRVFPLLLPGGTNLSCRLAGSGPPSQSGTLYFLLLFYHPLDSRLSRYRLSPRTTTKRIPSLRAIASDTQRQIVWKISSQYENLQGVRSQKSPEAGCSPKLVFETEKERAYIRVQGSPVRLLWQKPDSKLPGPETLRTFHSQCGPLLFTHNGGYHSNTTCPAANNAQQSKGNCYGAREPSLPIWEKEKTRSQKRPYNLHVCALM